MLALDEENGHRKNRRHRRRNHHKSDQGKRKESSSSSSRCTKRRDFLPTTTSIHTIAMKAIRARPKTTSCCDGTNRVERNIRGDISLPKLRCRKNCWRLFKCIDSCEKRWCETIIGRHSSLEAVLDYVKIATMRARMASNYSNFCDHAGVQSRIFVFYRQTLPRWKHVPAEYKDFECKSE